MEEQSLEGKYQAEIARLDEEHRQYEKLWTQVPRFALVVLLAPVVGFVWGFGWFVAELLVSAALVGTRAYLIAVRKHENRWNRDRLVDDLRETLRGGPTLTA
jgi:glucose-6-phosphate-specific signal transduction histidine kinase